MIIALDPAVMRDLALIIVAMASLIRAIRH